MCNQWMIDVLKDMRQVALKNAMLEFAESLDDAMFTALGELRDRGAGTNMTANNDSETGSILRTSSSHGNRTRPPEAS